jgi:uncharacterized protein (TIGR00369 family)
VAKKIDTEGFASGVAIVELMTPQMANFFGKIFGGAILSLVDKAAFVCASRYAGTAAVTACIQQVDFLYPIEVGELVTLFAQVDYVGKTSMEISIRIMAENIRDGQKRLVNTCYVTMVAVRDGHPTAVPALIPKTREEKKAYAQGQVRRLLKQRHAEAIAKTLEEMKKIPPEQLEGWLKKHKLK